MEYNIKCITDYLAALTGCNVKMLSVFDKDISSWNVSNVTDMSSMFEFADFNKDISSWNVENVIDMSSMFKGSDFNQDISSWNVSNVKYNDDFFCFLSPLFDHKNYWPKFK